MEIVLIIVIEKEYIIFGGKSMPIVVAKCTQCGANLKVDNSLEAAVCSYCNAAYIVEKAINNYNETNYNYTNISNSVINIIGQENDIERLLKNVSTFVKIGKSIEAKHLLADIINNFPDDYRAWLYLARIEEKSILELIKNENYKIALTLAHENGIEEILSQDEINTIDNATKLKCPYCSCMITVDEMYCDECGMRLLPY